MNRDIIDDEYDVSDYDEIESGPIGLHGTLRLHCQPWGAKEEIVSYNKGRVHKTKSGKSGLLPNVFK